MVGGCDKVPVQPDDVSAGELLLVHDAASGDELYIDLGLHDVLLPAHRVRLLVHLLQIPAVRLHLHPALRRRPRLLPRLQGSLLGHLRLRHAPLCRKLHSSQFIIVDQSTLEFFFIDWEKPKALTERDQAAALLDEERNKLNNQPSENQAQTLKAREEEKKKKEQMGDGTRNVRKELNDSGVLGETL